MKTIITATICIGLLAVCGCATGNYTWTPTAEEWARMTPMERTAWSANEMQTRQNAAAIWQNFHQDLLQYDSQFPKIIAVPGNPPVKLESWRYGQLPGNYVLPSQNPALFPGRRQKNSTYWQEKNAEDEYWQRHFGFSVP